MLELKQIIQLLKEHHLLKETIYRNQWHYDVPQRFSQQTVEQLTYDSRTASPQSLFFCKGLGFQVSYLEKALSAGASIYVSEDIYEEELAESAVSQDHLAVIVTDVKKAMAVLAMAFYDYPQQDLQIIGYTGTKGKTTAAYFCKNILQEATANHLAMFSTMETILDGETSVKSTLTTPESLDLYRMMRQAVDFGMTHLVMEVSSQAYKTERVYGLTFDVGVFLNISPDHIGAVEHPTFDDYFYCKRRLLTQSKQVILNADSDYFSLILETANRYAEKVWTYSETNKETDYQFQPEKPGTFKVTSQQDPLHLVGEYDILLSGDFNQGNALSGMIATSLVGANPKAIHTGVARTKVPGRMEKLQTNQGVSVYIDYAHNYLSLKTLLSFVREEHPKGRLLVVIGSTGGKGVSRRADFSRVLSEFADEAILTTDDPGKEDPLAIISEIKQGLAETVVTKTLLDREEAIQYGLSQCGPEDTLVLAGKGADCYQIVGTERLSYPGDLNVVNKLIESGY
ncbi:UDP-N-acetylmuramoyl-L-alanyl-D-glutamate--L-lysine ligase [Vagococcus humatus]|uniref:UDP-N-acetylmuramyl-tripeptide synthetase n=1 Tax=Vagococcus humatus TaxID=1889241 RepID=A0A429Z7U9_9ENTE|nr:UDP-N-acetylmuramoyl-L-alanyl-D-glutamate--L-lysine ligase [Vagococcus humatus]RST89743.1 UDP-N-acetylmuramoyl-L-alanyl-D-glutamate--L-lysine ligase [Vagococcus humatus]